MRKGYYRFPIDIDFQTRPQPSAVLPTAHIRFETDLSSFPPRIYSTRGGFLFSFFSFSLRISQTDNRGSMKIRAQS